MVDTDTKFLRACLAAIAPSLGDEESVISLERGQTRYGRQTFLFYKVQIATFVAKTGNTPVNPRTLCIAVNVDSPDTASTVPLSEWGPLS
jgi:hypothetical protein